jgi:cell pole-organizing protein PopZ
MANPNTAHEPSMEEILASIRQIISEEGDATPANADAEHRDASDEPKPTLRAFGAESASSASPSTSKGPSMTPAISENPARAAGPADASGSPVEPGLRRSDIEAVSRPASDIWRSGQPAENRSLLSPESGTAVSGAFSALAHTIMAQNARTLEGLVADMVRPMLKEWLDENLPSIVERLVREEIERVSRGRR